MQTKEQRPIDVQPASAGRFDGSTPDVGSKKTPTQVFAPAAKDAFSHKGGQRGPIAILGVPLDPVTTVEALDRIEQMVLSRKPHYLVTANVDFLVQAQSDVELHRILCDAHLVLCDGTPLVWASQLLGNSLPERVAGADLVPLLIEVAAQQGYRIFFLGASPEVAKRGIQNLHKRYPDLVAHHYSPPFRKLLEMDHEEITRQIRDAQPDLLFVCFGCPKQEKWIAMHYQSLGVPVAVGVGATLDFLAGEVRRAPVWMQRSGTEWIFRLLQEPRRLFRRYVKDLWVFGGKMVVQSWEMQLRSRRPAGQDQPRVVKEQAWKRMRLPERVDLAMVHEQPSLTEQILGEPADLLVEADGVKFIDSTGIGLLIRFQKSLHQNGRQMVLISPSADLERALSLMHLKDFFTFAPDGPSAQALIQAVPAQPCTSASRTADTPCLAWHGEITAANANDVWQYTEKYFSQSPPATEWTVDLTQVRFIDSSGLGLMVRLNKLARSRGVRLQWAGINPAVRNVIQLAKLETVLLQA